jgi:hypothetical protein
VSPVAPAVTQAAVGAGHWAAGRRQRALAAWVNAAGFGLVAWGLGTEAPTWAEWQKNIEQQKDLWRERGLEVPVTAGTLTRRAFVSGHTCSSRTATASSSRFRAWQTGTWAARRQRTWSPGGLHMIYHQHISHAGSPNQIAASIS